MANRLTHPRYKVAKTYVAEVKGRIGTEAVERLKKGVWLAEGKTGKASAKILRRSHKGSLLEITVRQGLNRQIRRMLAKVDLLGSTKWARQRVFCLSGGIRQRL